MASVIAWDIETVPDLKGFAAANGLEGKTDDEIRAAMGDKFPKHIYHAIICIGALVAHQDNDRWVVDVLGAPSVAKRSEKELIASFVDRIAELKPQLVTFNGLRTAFACTSGFYKDLRDTRDAQVARAGNPYTEYQVGREVRRAQRL